MLLFINIQYAIEYFENVHRISISKMLLKKLYKYAVTLITLMFGLHHRPVPIPVQAGPTSSRVNGIHNKKTGNILIYSSLGLC